MMIDKYNHSVCFLADSMLDYNRLQVIVQLSTNKQQYSGCIFIIP